MIEARSLGVTHRGRWVLQDINLRVRRGEVVGLIGPPEAGKSILLKALCGLRAIEAGDIFWDGAPLGPHNLAQLQGQVGFAFQNNALFDAETVFDNVAFPLRQRGYAAAQVDAQVEAQLRRVELWDAAHKLPRMLSGGMQKRLGVARATVTRPGLGLFDEPTSGLDPQTSGKILAMLTGLAEQANMAALVVSNDLPALLPFVERLVMLHRGRLIYDGAAAAIAACGRPEVVQFATGGESGPL